MIAIYCVKWTIKGSGWIGKPDGFSYHRTARHAEAYIKRIEGSPIDDGTASAPFIVECTLPLYEEVQTKNDVRTYGKRH